MILVPIDEAAAFDRYIITLVKSDNGLDTFTEMSLLQVALTVQLGTAKFQEVIRSDEYNKLHQANEIAFRVTEEAKQDKCKASEADEANYRRFLAKQALQMRYFPGRPLQEAKTQRPRIHVFNPYDKE